MKEFHKEIFIHLCGFSWVQDFSNCPSHFFCRIQLEVTAEICKTAWLYFRGHFSMIVTYCLYCLSSGLWFNNICGARDLWIWDCADHASIICVSYKLSEFVWTYCLLMWLIYRSICEMLAFQQSSHASAPSSHHNVAWPEHFTDEPHWIFED